MCIHDTCVPLQPWLLQPPRLLRLTNLRQSTHTHTQHISTSNNTTHTRVTTQCNVQHRRSRPQLLAYNHIVNNDSEVSLSPLISPSPSLSLTRSPRRRWLSHLVFAVLPPLLLQLQSHQRFFCKFSKIENYFLQNILDLDNGWSDTVVVDNSKYSIK